MKLQHGDKEIRFEQSPFPLYPGEELLGKLEKLKVVRKDQAFRLSCVEDFDDEGIERLAGDEWLLQGPKTYMPRKERVKIRKLINPFFLDSRVRPRSHYPKFG